MPPVADFVREGLTLLGMTGGPILLALGLVGLVVGILQAATQINDPSISFLPRALTLVLIVVAFGGWITSASAQFLVATAGRMANSGP